MSTDRQHGCAVWLTGLPSSGKSTLARSLSEKLRGNGQPVEILDGDEIRDTISADLGFSPEDRREQARRIIFVTGLLVRNGVNVIVPLITPYSDSRDLARSNLSNYMEVYVRCPLEECVRRDPKGLYAKAQSGEIENFTGVSDPYEIPENPEIILDTNSATVEVCVELIFAKCQSLGYLSKATISGVGADS